jgi:hypothetical protein
LFLKSPTSSFFFVSTKIAGGHRSFHRGVDVGELRIAIRMLAALPRLAVGLATVVQRAQQVGDDALAGLEP